MKKIVFALLCLLLPVELPAASGQRPNILFILVDDLGYGDLSCYSDKSAVKTPHLDALARTGVRMVQAYGSPVCSPTRAAFLTGRFAERSGVYGNYDGSHPGIGPKRPCFAENMQKAGYRTAWFGKWHQGWDVSNHPKSNGFEVAYGFLGGMHDYFDPAEGDHHVGGPYARHAYVFDGYRPVSQMKYLTDELTDRAIQVMKAGDDRPYFIYLAYNTPHTPIQAPDDLIRKYLKPGADPVEAVRCAMVESLDRSVGRLIEALKASQQDQNTLLVFMSDNGGESERYNGGLRGTKMTMWEGGIRVPMIASWPGRIPAGTTSDAICSIVDLPATFLTLSGKTDNLGDGVDLMPLWTGQRKGHAHESLVWALDIRGPAGTRPTVDNVGYLAVRMGDWKLVREKKRPIDALYNLCEDPGERRDLSASRSEKKAELLAQANRYLESCPPSCGLEASRDTRAAGDKAKPESLRKHCRELLKTVP